MTGSARSFVLGFLLPFAFVGLALAIVENTPLSSASPFLLLIAAVLLSALLGGLFAGLFATFLGVIGVALLMGRPGGTIDLRSPSNLLSMLVFVLVAVMLSAMRAASEHSQQAGRNRARQRAAIASLGLRGLGSDLAGLLQYGAALVAETLDVEYSVVLELLPNGKEMLLKAGHGWPPDLVEYATVDAGLNSQAGYILNVREPVIVRDLRTEKRFSGPSLLVDHQVVSGVSVIILGHGGPYGILGAHTRQHRAFTQDDVNFLQGAANVLATAMDRDRGERALDITRHRFQALFNDAVDAILFIDDEGRYVDANLAASKLTGYARDELLGMHFWDITPPDHVAAGQELWKEFVKAGKSSGEYTLLTKDGTEIIADYRILANVTPGVHFSVLHDVTVRNRNEKRLQAQYALTRALAQAGTLAEATPQILKTLCDSSGAVFGTIWNVDRAAQVLRCVDTWHVPYLDAEDFAKETRELTFTRGACFPGLIWETGQAQWVVDLALDSNVTRRTEALAHGMHSAFGFPISNKSEFTGVLEFFSHEAREPDSALLGMMQAFGSQIGQFLERKKAEEALRLAREQQSIILRGVRDGITAQAPDGKLIYANDAAARMIGYSSPEELLAAPVDQIMANFQLSDENGNPLPVERLPGRQALLGQETSSTVVRFQNNQTGEQRSSLLTASPVYNESGQVEFSINIFHDITERQVEEDLVREQKELLQVTLASIADAVIATDARGQITFMNSVAEDLVGWAWGEARGQELQAIFRAVDEETRKPLSNPAARALQQKERVGPGDHAILISKSGRELWIESSAAPIRNQAGNVMGAVLVFRDVSERRRAERDVSHLAAIIQSSDDAIFSKTIEGTILTWNPGAERLYGYTAEEMIGNSVTKLYPPERIDEFYEIRDLLRRGQGVERHDGVRMRKDGQLVHVSISISLLRDGRGHAIGASTVARDVTERKRVEEAQGFLTQASDVLSSSLDYETTLRSIARLAVPQVADWCAVDMLQEDGTIKQLALAHVDPTKVEVAYDLERRYPPDPNATRGVHEVIRTGRPEIASEIPDELIVASARDPEHLRTLRALGITSYMSVPLNARGRTLGAISFISAESGRHYGPFDLGLAQDLARRAALAVDNARLYRDSQILNEELEQRVVTRTIALRKANKKLEEEAVERQRVNEQLRLLSAHLQSAREEERIRIAREIHDEFGQILTAVKMDLSLLGRKLEGEQSLTPQEVIGELDATSRLVDDSIQVMHEIIRELRPEILDHLGLRAALEWQLQDFARRAEVECTFTSLIDEVNLDLDRSTAVFRIFQETLSNVARHANATRVEAVVREDVGALILEIRDNGKGMTPQELNGSSSFGILGMRERAHIFGGEVQIASTPGQGTAVIVRVPEDATARLSAPLQDS